MKVGTLEGGYLLEGTLPEGTLLEGTLQEGTLWESTLLQGTFQERTLLECTLLANYGRPWSVTACQRRSWPAMTRHCWPCFDGGPRLALTSIGWPWSVWADLGGTVRHAALVLQRVAWRSEHDILLQHPTPHFGLPVSAKNDARQTSWRQDHTLPCPRFQC